MATRRPTRPAGAPAAGRAAAAGASRTGRAADVLATILAAPLAEAGFDLEDVVLRRAGSRHTVAVAVDRDGGVDLDAVAAATAVVSAALDARDDDLPAQLLGAYDLEVSSRGAASPLTAPRHWCRSASRLVEVRRTDGSAVTGRIIAADDGGADLDVDGRLVHVTYDEVRTAVLQLEFRRPAGLDPGTDAAEGQEETP